MTAAVTVLVVSSTVFAVRLALRFGRGRQARQNQVSRRVAEAVAYRHR